MSMNAGEQGYFALVAKIIDEFSLVINKGSKDGVKLGERYLIYGLGGDVIDPDTGNSLGSLELVRGTGKVSHVQERIATLKSDQFERPHKTIRKIKRRDPFSHVSAFGRAETIEEEESDPDRLEFENPEKGDRVRPV